MNIIPGNINFNGLSYDNVPQALLLHHAESKSCTIQDIDSWHKQRGWSGVGYHYFVRKDGSIYSGRPENAQGAHCPGYNTGSISICAEGAYGTETMPDVQKNAISALGRDVCSRYGFSAIYGHREVYATSCPGDNYPLNEIKSLINSSVSIVQSQPVTINTPVNNSSRTWLQVGDKGAQVSEVQDILNKLGFNAGTVDGDYGKKTKNAVYNFQQAIKIPADGLAGVVTLKALREIIAQPTDGVSYPHYEYATRYIQYKVGSLVDGIFGDGTARDVKAWQQRNGLGSDGIVGQHSWGTLI